MFSKLPTTMPRIFCSPLRSAGTSSTLPTSTTSSLPSELSEVSGARGAGAQAASASSEQRDDAGARHHFFRRAMRWRILSAHTEFLISASVSSSFCSSSASLGVDTRSMPNLDCSNMPVFTVLYLYAPRK